LLIILQVIKIAAKVFMPIKGILLMDDEMLYILDVNSLWYNLIGIST
jgi:hypothetical protein